LVCQLDAEACEESTEEPIYRQAVANNINSLKRDTPPDFLPFYDTKDIVDRDVTIPKIHEMYILYCKN
jgi:hypothetical protein